MRGGCEVAVSDEVEEMFCHAVRKDGRSSHVPESKGAALEQPLTQLCRYNPLPEEARDDTLGDESD